MGGAPKTVMDNVDKIQRGQPELTLKVTMMSSNIRKFFWHKKFKFQSLIDNSFSIKILNSGSVGGLPVM